MKYRGARKAFQEALGSAERHRKNYGESKGEALAKAYRAYILAVGNRALERKAWKLFSEMA